MILFVEAVGLGLVRIGEMSSPVEQELARLQDASPVRLNLLAMMEGDEQKIHTRLDDARAHGKWFYLVAGLRRILKDAETKNGLESSVSLLEVAGDRLVDWMKRKELGEVSMRDILRAGIARDASEAIRVAKCLEDRGSGRVIKKRTENGQASTCFVLIVKEANQ